MRLGILDFCLLREGLKPFHSLHETLLLAQEAERLGYSRFWMAEHHELDRKSTRLNSSHSGESRMPSSA